MAKGRENLIPNNLRSKEEVRRNSSKGGIKSGETRRMQSAVRQILKMKLPKGYEEIEKALEESGIMADNNSGIAYAMALKALQGDKQCADWIRDTGGEKPKEEVSVEGVNIKFEDDLK